jgi:hypothetical protein
MSRRRDSRPCRYSTRRQSRLLTRTTLLAMHGSDERTFRFLLLLELLMLVLLLIRLLGRFARVSVEDELELGGGLMSAWAPSASCVVGADRAGDDGVPLIVGVEGVVDGW